MQSLLILLVGSLGIADGIAQALQIFVASQEVWEGLVLHRINAVEIRIDEACGSHHVFVGGMFSQDQACNELLVLFLVRSACIIYVRGCIDQSVSLVPSGEVVITQRLVIGDNLRVE